MAYSCSYVPKCCQMKKHELWVSELELELQLTSLPCFHKAEGDMDSVFLEVVTQQLKSMQAELFPVGFRRAPFWVLCFLGYINNLDVNVRGMIKTFANNTKIGRVVDSEEDNCRLQVGINEMVRWAEMWQMEFNLKKCEVMHLGRSNKAKECTINERILRGEEEVRDLGLNVHRSLKNEFRLLKPFAIRLSQLMLGSTHMASFEEPSKISSIFAAVIDSLVNSGMPPPLLSPRLSRKFTVTGPTHPVVAIVGEDAVLECRLVPDLSASNIVVRWLKSDLGSAVHAYRNGEDDTAAQDHDYRGRTEQFKDELSKGNVSLRIKNTRVFDEGKYICSVDDETDFEETVIELKVGGLGREHWIQIEGYHQNGIQLVCESNGWFPQPQVLWTGGEGQNLTTQSKINYHRDSKGLVNVQSNVAVTRDSTNRFKCLIRNNLLKKEQEATIQIAGDFFPAISGWLVFLSVILSLVIVALAAGNIWTVKQHRYFKELEVDKSIKQFDQWKSLIDSDWKKISECQDWSVWVSAEFFVGGPAKVQPEVC
ncbi:butyrophilin subfamily 3 member A2-like [Heterodontus francisci]|uniref:butyrophilin subfamily 3 member A2-like n=1 Tax=Heterodontus francisci TaxID=7792 RepID=UPI00355B2494